MYWLLLILFGVMGFQTAYGQTIIINSTDPCFLNYTAGVELWENCNFDQDYLTFALMPWEWITGGYFSMILVSTIILAVYIKYQRADYPIIIGMLFLPIAYAFFPGTFIVWGTLMAFVAIGILVWYIFIRQTKEYAG